MSRSYSNHWMFILLGLMYFECAVPFYYGGPGTTSSKAAVKTKPTPLEMIFSMQDSSPERESNYRSIVASMFQQQPISHRHEHPHYQQFHHHHQQQQHQQYPQQQQQQQQQQHQQFDYSNSIRAAVNTHHIVDYIDVPIESTNFVPQTILVESHRIPLNILFQSKSSNLNIQNDHQPSQGSFQESSSEDEPHRLFHRVTKPIIQEVYEVIVPYRKVTQEVQPVQEDIQTIVSRAVQSDNKYVAINAPQPQQQQQLHQYQKPPARQEYRTAMESPKVEHHLYGASYTMASHVEPDLFTNVIPGSRSLLEREREPTERFHRPLNKNSYILSMPHSLLPERENLFTSVPTKSPFLYQAEVTADEPVRKEEPETEKIELRMMDTSTTTPLEEGEEEKEKETTNTTPAATSPVTTVTPTTTVKPEPTSSSADTKTPVTGGNDERPTKANAIAGDVAERMLMMYSGGGSLFMTKPELKPLGSASFLRRKNAYSELMPASSIDSVSY